MGTFFFVIILFLEFFFLNYEVLINFFLHIKENDVITNKKILISIIKDFISNGFILNDFISNPFITNLIDFISSNVIINPNDFISNDFITNPNDFISNDFITNPNEPTDINNITNPRVYRLYIVLVMLTIIYVVHFGVPPM